MITEPMLAGTVKDVTKLRFPLIATPKLDGIRALMIDGKLVSRKFKPIPNKFIREICEEYLALPNGLDGELLIPDAPFNEVASAVMSQDGEPEFEYWIFDWVQNTPELALHYNKRVGKLRYYLQDTDTRGYLKFVPTRFIEDARKLDAYEQNCLEEGYEGVMLRAPDSPYKCGRSTFNEHYLLKLKRFEDSEAEVLGVVELMRNENVAEQDAFGRTKRSHKAEGKVGAGIMGALKVRDLKSGVEFEIGTGFTAAHRAERWKKGDIVTYKFQPHGVKDKPRAPVFKARRLD